MLIPSLVPLIIEYALAEWLLLFTFATGMASSADAPASVWTFQLGQLRDPTIFGTIVPGATSEQQAQAAAVHASIHATVTRATAAASGPFGSVNPSMDRWRKVDLVCDTCILAIASYESFIYAICTCTYY